MSEILPVAELNLIVGNICGDCLTVNLRIFPLVLIGKFTN